MKDFTYYEIDHSLDFDACSWLDELGLRETRWILDTDWILTQSSSPTFKVWVGEE